MEFFQTDTLANVSGLKPYFILVVKAFQKFRNGELLFVNYGSSNRFMLGKEQTFFEGLHVVFSCGDTEWSTLRILMR